MAVRFLIGRAGTGKTHHCLDRITSACRQDPLGPPIIFLVPEQGSYQAEKALLTFSDLKGLTRAQVLSFTRLADFVFARGAAPRLPRLTQAHRRVIVMLLVSQARREDPEGMAAARGIEDALLDFIAETRQQAVDPEDIRVVIGTLLSGKGHATPLTARLLADKLARLTELLEGYRNFSRDRFQDPEDSLVHLATQIISAPALQGADIYVDGFTGFTPVEEKILLALARRARTLSISIYGDPGRSRVLLENRRIRRHAVFQPVEETLSDLVRLFDGNQVKIDKPVYFDDPTPPRFRAGGIVAVEHHFFSSRPHEQTDGGGVTFHESRTTREEAREAVELAAEWMRRHGWKPGEIGIMTRDLEEYAAPLSQALRTLRIPHFIDRAQPLAVHPFVTGIMALCRATLIPGRDLTRHLIDFAKSGLPPIPRRELDRLEYEVTQHPRRPSEWFSDDSWVPPPPRSPMDDDNEQGREVDSFTAVIDTTRRALAAEVMALRHAIGEDHRNQGPLDSFLKAVALRLVAMAGSRPLSDLDHRILERILEMLAIAVETAGSEIVGWDTALELLQRLLGDLTLPRIPPMSGELFVGQVDRSRQPPLRGVILLGLAEGNFPRVMMNHSLVNDGERDLLEKSGLRLRPSGRRQFEREAMHAYRAMTSGSECLALFRPRENSQGEAIPAGAFWEDLRGVLPGVPVTTFPRRDDPERAWLHRELVAAALRQGAGTHLDPFAQTGMVMPLLSRFLGMSGCSRVYTEATWNNSATLSPELLGAFHGERVSVSATQLESFARCPYQHFLKYMLRPAETLLPRFERRDAGNYFHAVLRQFTQLLRERDLAGASLNKEEILDVLEEAREEPARRLNQTGLLDGGGG
ncbi:MAG: PD-(D/E)XK nuclease family protein, partial [Candidatus Sumerlaeia bacterium]|nr:PD-(D/E)XK nuclease family protein [Candidatus Sumerlaeia bacterium]